MSNFELSSPVKYANKILGFYTEGPWETVNDANLNIIPALRVQGMGCIIQGVGQPAKKYWYKDGIDDTDLVEFISGGVTQWGPITGNIEDQTDLQEALSLKQDRANGLVSGGAITIGSFGGSGTNNDIQVNEGRYFISPNYYDFATTPAATPWLDVALCAGGLSRYVEIIGNTSGQVIRRDGVASAIPVHPTILNTEVSLGWFLVGDSVFEVPVSVSATLIDDNVIALDKTWSSNKLKSELDLKLIKYTFAIASENIDILTANESTLIDGLSAGAYFLLPHQTNPAENGIYTLENNGSFTYPFFRFKLKTSIFNDGNSLYHSLFFGAKNGIVNGSSIYACRGGSLTDFYKISNGDVGGSIPPLNDVLSVGNDAGTEQIKNIGDATEETDAMSYGQFLRGLAGLTSYFFSSTNSDIATYESMPDLANYTSAAEANNGGVVVSTTPTSLGKFATNSGFPNVTKIPIGLFSAHVEVQKGAGANNYATFFKLYKRNLAGTETLLVTSDYSSEVSVNTRQQVTVSAFIANPITLLATDRLVIEWLSVMTASTATITMYYDGATNARFAIPVVSANGGGGLSDGDKGDIIVSGSGSTLTIDAGAVTLAKQADVAAGTVFYRKTAGTGSPEVQTLATLKTDLGLVADAINNGTVDVAPSQNAVFDALALKQDIGTVASVSTVGVITGMSSTGVSLVRLTTTNPTGLGGIANGVSLKDLYVFNDTGNTLTIYNEYSGEGTAANKIISGADLTWANQQMLHVKYDSTESRWVVVSLGGNNYRPHLAGIGDRVVIADFEGKETATIGVFDPRFSIGYTPATGITSTTKTNIWVANIGALTIPALSINTLGFTIDAYHRHSCVCGATPSTITFTLEWGGVVLSTLVIDLATYTSTTVNVTDRLTLTTTTTGASGVLSGSWEIVISNNTSGVILASYEKDINTTTSLTTDQILTGKIQFASAVNTFNPKNGYVKQIC